jgi:hypothetical protein
MQTRTAPWDYNRPVLTPDTMKCPKCGNLAVMQDIGHKIYWCFGCGIIDLAPDHDAIIADAKWIYINRQLLINEKVKG